MVIFHLLTAMLAAQEPTIRTTVPLVVAPTTVTDAAGKHIDGLTATDFLLLDNGRQREIQVDVSYLPISLVVAIQTSGISGPALEKIRKIGGMVLENSEEATSKPASRYTAPITASSASARMDGRFCRRVPAGGAARRTMQLRQQSR